MRASGQRLAARLRRRLDALARAERGAVAVEFALLFVPFLLLFFGLLELALIYFASLTLENAVTDAGRLIRTGQAQTGGAEAFKTKTCERMSWMAGGCPSALTIDVRTVSTFGSSSALTTPQAPCWDPGGPSSLVLVRAYYKWPVFTPLLDTVLPSVGGNRVLTMTTAFANEPYDASAAPDVSCPA